MNQHNDPNYLIAEQYRDASNLNARIEIHRRFSANPYGWTRWLFDLIGAAAGPDVLELGCAELVERLSQGRGGGDPRQLERRVASAFAAAEAVVMPDQL